MSELTHLTVAQSSQLLQKKEISSVELAQAYLDKISQHSDLNTFLSVRAEATLEQAKQADKRIAEGTATPLTGVPIAHKDIFVTREWPSTAASKMLEGYMSPFDATVVELLKKAGMVCLGKTTATSLPWAQLTQTAPMARPLIRGIRMRFREAPPAVPLPVWPLAWLLLPPHGYRRFYSPTIRLLRSHRYQTHLRSSESLGHDCFRIKPGYCRRHCTNCGGLRSCPLGNDRL